MKSRSRRPHRSPARVVGAQEVASIIKLRKERNLGPKGIQSELLRVEGRTFSTVTIWKVLDRYRMEHVRLPKRPRRPRRYTRPIPGDRVQLATMQLAPGRIQFTAIDDCTRMRVLGLYQRRTAANAVRFLEEPVLEEFPSPFQRIQTDRSGEFLA